MNKYRKFAFFNDPGTKPKEDPLDLYFRIIYCVYHYIRQSLPVNRKINNSTDQK